MEDKDIQRIFNSIDLIMKEVDSAKIEPDFSEEIAKRNKRDPATILSDSDVLRRMARVIAFAGARATAVEEMLDTGIFEDIFHNFEIDKVAQMDSMAVNQHWVNSKVNNIKEKNIQVIRFRKKLTAIIDCGKSLSSIKSKYGSFMNFLKECDFPSSLDSEADIEKFWQGFNRIRTKLKKEDVPYIRQFTSLSHFLIMSGYDCIKSDVIVMKVAKQLGIIDSDKETEKNKLKVVRFIQRYSVNRNIRPSIVDFYLLIYGRQSWAIKFVNSSFYERKIHLPCCTR